MSRKAKGFFSIFLSFILITSVIAGVILTTRILYKVNHKTEDEIMAEKNEVVIGDESILYVDLTKKPDDYEKIAQVDENNEEVIEVNDNVFDQINQNYFNMEFNLDSGTVIADGNEINISDLLDITEENELLSSTDVLYNYLNDNIIGDIEYKDGTIKIENPYTTNTIMMKTSNLTEIEECGEVQSIVKVADDIYCVHYGNAQDTKEGYNILKESNFVENICKDAQITILDDISASTEETSIETLGVTGNNYAWGVITTGLSKYVNKLNYGNNNTEIKVAVLDTGVRITHEVFTNETTSDRIDTTYSYNYVNSNTDISDDNGHGTKVAGILAEATSNNVKLVPVKIMGSDGKGNFSAAMQGLSAVAGNVDVINLSLGMKESELTSDVRSMGESILQTIYNDGKAVICASGNDGEENVYYPASSQYTLAVSALNTENSIATFSNYGSTIDFAAPGQGLILPHYTGDNLYNSSFESTSEEYRKNSGTSFAAPFVTAAISLIKSENYNYTVEQLKDVLIDNCEDLGTAGKDEYYGYGSLDFNNNMFSKPVIASVDISEEWGVNNTIKVKAVCGNNIEKWAHTTSEEPPEEWKAFQNPASYVTATFIVSYNGDYYIWFKDENGNVVNQLVTVQYVDNTRPTITNQLEISENSATSFKAKLSVQDTESGLSKIDWYYKKANDTDYQMVTDTYTTTGTGETNNTEKTHQFSDLESNTTYSVYAEVYDIMGNKATTSVITTSTLESNGNTTVGNNTVGNNTVGNNTVVNNTVGNNTVVNNTVGNNTVGNNTVGNNTVGNNTVVNNTVGNNTVGNNTVGNNTVVNNTVGNNTVGNNTVGNNTVGNNTVGNNTVENNTVGNNTVVNNAVENNTVGNNTIGSDTKGNNTVKNNTVVNIINSKSDNSMAANNLPYTGDKKIIILFTIVVLISGIFTFVKYKKLKEIK